MFKRLLPAVAAATLLAACADEDLAPVITFTDLEIGAFPRLVNFAVGEYDLNNLGSTAVEYTIEFVDEDEGNNTTAYRLYATFQDRNEDNGDQSSDEMLIRDIAVADLPRNENGLPEVTITVPSTEIVSTFGLDESALLAGDRVVFRGTVIRADGTEFGESNSSSAITNAFQGLLNFNAVYTCPLDDDQFSGAYTITVVGGDNATGFGPNFEDGATVTLAPVAGATTQRDFSAIILPAIGGFEQDFTLEFTCDRLVIKTLDTGLSCGGPAIVYGSAGETPFDFNDSSTFDVDVDLFGRGNGGCGALSPGEVTLRFTRN